MIQSEIVKQDVDRVASAFYERVQDMSVAVFERYRQCIGTGLIMGSWPIQKRMVVNSKEKPQRENGKGGWPGKLGI